MKKDNKVNKTSDFILKNPNRKVIKKNTVYRRTKMSNFGLKFAYLYTPMSLRKMIIITILMAIFFGVISVFFVKNVGIYNFGLAAIGQSAARLIITLIPENSGISESIRNLIDQAIFWNAYIFLSIPLFIFGYKKIGKVFTLLTVIFLFVSSFVSFGIGQIPDVNGLYLIGDFSNSSVKENLSDYKKDLSSIIPLLWVDGGNTIALLVYSIFYGFMLAIVFAVIAIIGGTAGVTGIIGEWYSNKTQKSFGCINGYINLTIILVSVVIGSYIPGSLLINEASKVYSLNPFAQATPLVLKKAWSFELYLSPNFVATIVSNVIFVLVLGRLFPKFKLVRVEIFSMYSEEIKEAVASDAKTVNGVTLFAAQGGFKGEALNVVTSVALFKQVPRIIKNVRKVDTDAFISISEIKSIDGYIYLPKEKF
ncbi:DUF2179 domain-containing protein [Mycoplasmopsis alligatoris]|uniref:DUF2179 domain-containing protein n=1 Tax=Mycoplasmopsis alligatoris A21JP2 TaxID=747682 RepID=D4XVH1_9BACT|nr:DUF2179 domain-containing protein [Mycoplasmopsis alligatoris]EFF41599.1 conserved hypothetical protein [Mycoplasmopsis alligatoris A21JP2]